ncbi:hypothetical protein H0H93_000199 [Arthromyces matolae]|nr:hypothetical protein H0H93_000199 [Arthromyces matolae]
MSQNRPRESADRKKKKYRSDGTPIWAKRYIDGPGIWVSCVKGKERQTVAECFDIFESVASELWPLDSRVGDMSPNDEESEDEDLSIEAQIANEINAMKKPKHEPRFTNCQTNTTCVVFISCKPPVDPVQLVVKLVRDVQMTGVVRSRCVHRLVPVTAQCGANLPDIQGLCRKVLDPFFSSHAGKKFSYKIELRLRNHSVIPRQDLIEHIAKCVPEGHTVELTNPQVFILVEVFKSVCGMSVVQNYYDLQKFNMQEIANNLNDGAIISERQIFGAKERGLDV